MKEKIKIILSDQFTRLSLIFSLVFLIPLLVLIFITFNNIPPLIPFFNSMPWGEERLLSSHYVIFIPIVLVSVFFINVIQATLAYSKYVLVARLLMINTLIFLLLGLLAYLQILFLTF